MSWIPKVIIGDPETSDIAYDVMPNYRPAIAEGVRVRERVVFHDGHQISLGDDPNHLIHLCNGTHTLADILEYAEDLFDDGPGQDISIRVYLALKELRSLGLVERDNRFTREGLFIRTRRLAPEGKMNVRWMYLPPFAQRVFELCSGSYSVREIALKIQGEFGEEELDALANNRDSLIAAVHQSCRRLKEEMIIDWIDSEESRRQRLKERIISDK